MTLAVKSDSRVWVDTTMSLQDRVCAYGGTSRVPHGQPLGSQVKNLVVISRPSANQAIMMPRLSHPRT